MTDTAAPPLLKAALAAVDAWRYPSMDGKKLRRAMDELEDAARSAARDWRLSHGSDE